jgi:hypothetical protein
VATVQLHGTGTALGDPTVGRELAPGSAVDSSNALHVQVHSPRNHLSPGPVYTAVWQRIAAAGGHTFT